MLATKPAPTRAKRRVKFDNFQELVDSLGGIPASRILFDPPPGTATVRDVIRYVDGDDRRLVELVNGTLVEKAMGFKESTLASFLIQQLSNFSDQEGEIGFVTGEGGTLRIMPKLLRLPDVAFVLRSRFPDGEMPEAPVPNLAPDIAAEVVGKGNTKAEMVRKVGEYFKAGVRLVWLVFPKTRTVRVYTSPKDVTLLTETDALTGGRVLPGFELPLTRLFGKLPSRAKKQPAKPKKKKK